MYTATMRYQFNEGHSDVGCTIWRDTVLPKAQKAPGLIRMQLLVAPPAALAIGTWKDKASAEAFMQTGIFKILMGKIGPLLAGQPKPEVWELDAYLTNED